MHAATQVPAEHTLPVPQAVPSARLALGAQVVTFPDASQVVEYVLHGSGVPLGVHAWFATQVPPPPPPSPLVQATLATRIAAPTTVEILIYPPAASDRWTTS
jgi:hypothetical protein